MATATLTCACPLNDATSCAEFRRDAGPYRETDVEPCECGCHRDSEDDADLETDDAGAT